MKSLKCLMTFCIAAILISSCQSQSVVTTSPSEVPTLVTLPTAINVPVIIATETATNTPSDFLARLDLSIAGDAPSDYEWSPDGSSLLLGAQNTGSFLVNISPDLKKWTTLDSGDAAYKQTGLQPSWSADGNWIVYCKGTGTRPVTTNTNSTTGIKQALQRGLASITREEDQIYQSMKYLRFRKDGSENQQITQLGADFCEETKWSSDGKSIAVFWTKDKENHLSIITNDGSLQEIVPEINPSGGSWSPDGTTLAITGGNELYIVKPDGSSLRMIPGISGVFGAPLWSKDAKTLVYMREDGIYIADITSGNNHKLTEGRLLYDSQSVLSPDGKWITFSSDRTGEPQVYIIKIDGTGLLTYRDLGFEDRDPIWSPDGKRLTFLSFQSGSGGGNIIVVPLSMFVSVQ